jgi:hypothetical protein
MIVYHVLVGPPNLSSRVRRMYNFLSTIDKGKMHHLLTSGRMGKLQSTGHAAQHTDLTVCVCVNSASTVLGRFNPQASASGAARHCS